jgi:hypothetical protein
VPEERGDARGAMVVEQAGEPLAVARGPGARIGVGRRVAAEEVGRRRLEGVRPAPVACAQEPARLEEAGERIAGAVGVVSVIAGSADARQPITPGP